MVAPEGDPHAHSQNDWSCDPEAHVVVTTGETVNGAAEEDAVNGVEISNRLAVGWSAGALCTSLSINLVGHLLMPFLTSRLGMSPSLAGGLISINKFLGLGLDPAVGALSDRTRSRMGRRRPWVLAGAILLPLSLVVLFMPPNWIDSVREQSLYFTFAILLFGAAYSVFRIPYLTMSAEMTTDSFVRARMISFKIIAISAGSLIGSSLFPVLIDVFGDDRAAYGKAAVVVAAIALATGLLCALSTAKARFTVRPKENNGSAWANLKSFLGNRPFAALIGARLAFFFGNTFKGTCAAYFIIFVMEERVSILGLYYMIITLLTVFGQPLWLRLVRAKGKRVTFVVSTGAYAIVNLGWLWLAHSPSMAGLIAISVLLGVTTGGIMLALESTLPDLMALDARQTGLRREGAFAAVFSLMEKLTSAVAIAVVGVFLQSSGFINSTQNVTQPASVIAAICLAMSVIPSAAAAVSVVLMHIWGLRDGEGSLAPVKAS